MLFQIWEYRKINGSRLRLLKTPENLIEVLGNLKNHQSPKMRKSNKKWAEAFREVFPILLVKKKIEKKLKSVKN